MNCKAAELSQQVLLLTRCSIISFERIIFYFLLAVFNIITDVIGYAEEVSPNIVNTGRSGSTGGCGCISQGRECGCSDLRQQEPGYRIRRWWGEPDIAEIGRRKGEA